MTDSDRLEAVVNAIAAEARRRPDFLVSLERALELMPPASQVTRRRGGAGSRPHRRPSAAIDPFRVLRDGGIDSLRAQLAQLSLDQLRDVVAQYRIEPYTLAMKWKSPSRLIALIAETIGQRSRKGDAFRGDVPEPGATTDHLGQLQTDDQPPLADRIRAQER